MFVVVAYIPIDSVDVVVGKMAKAGAGKIGNYQACAFKQVGVGQFQPIEGASPHIGEIGVLAQVEEMRVEMVCPEESIVAVLKELILAHPYEEPAYHVLQAQTLKDFV